MATLFCVRPVTRNIGNDLINRATSDLLYSVFGPDTAIVNVPALEGPLYGGLTAPQVYDMNRLADGVVVGGGNLFENGQLTVDIQALAALQVPLMLIGMSHGRIYDPAGKLSERTDAMAPAVIRALADKSCVVLVRDRGSQRLLAQLGVHAELGGCPSMFFPANPREQAAGERVLFSIRHPARMSVPPELQWRVADDVRRLIAGLETAYGKAVSLVCHDYRDIEFAKAFPDTPLLYFDDVDRYIAALRTCRLSVSYRLHAFLPCSAFGTPAVHVSYDERGAEMLATAGMAEWDIDLASTGDVVAAVLDRIARIERYHELCRAARPSVAALAAVSLAAVHRFRERVVQPPQAPTAC